MGDHLCITVLSLLSTILVLYKVSLPRPSGAGGAKLGKTQSKKPAVTLRRTSRKPAGTSRKAVGAAKPLGLTPLGETCYTLFGKKVCVPDEEPVAQQTCVTVLGKEICVDDDQIAAVSNELSTGTLEDIPGVPTTSGVTRGCSG